METMLGTALFGLNYGTFNCKPKLEKKRIFEILDYALEQQILDIDTAQAYGSSETNLGEYPNIHKFRISTKFKTQSTSTDIRPLFEKSLAQLRVPNLHSMLFHSYSDLDSIAGEKAYAFLQEQKQIGRLQKIGCSVYTPAEAVAAIQKYNFDIIQGPFSILDQRMVKSGALHDLRKRNVEFHARSIFLQGTVFLPASKILTHLPEVACKLELLQRLSKETNSSISQLTYTFLNQTSLVSKAIIGVDSISELKKFADHGAPVLPENWEMFSVTNENQIDPRKWRSPCD